MANLVIVSRPSGLPWSRPTWSLRLEGGLSFLAVLALALFVLTFVPARTSDTYLSDDMYMYLTVRQFADTGKLYFEDDLTVLDDENLMHPRGFVTQDGRVVPYNFLGLPVIYGGVYKLIGDKTEYFGTFLGVVALVALWGILGSLMPGQQKWTFPILFFATPLLYYMGRPYMNILPAIAFFLVGLYFLLRHAKRPSIWRISTASVFFALGIFCRYPDIVFVTPLVLIVLWYAYGKLLSIRLARDMLVYFVIVALVFGVPVLILNKLTYGSPFTYGYQLFNDAYYPNRGGSDAVGAAGLLNTIGVVLLPGGFDLAMFWTSIWKYLFVLTPILLTLGTAGYFSVLKNKVLPLKIVLALTALFVYVLLYQGSGAVWGTQVYTPSLGHTMVRYWMPIYLALAILTAYLVTDLQSAALKVGLVIGAVVVGLSGLFSGPDSLIRVRESIDNGERTVAATILPYTEENAVIYAGRSDKFIVSQRRVAAWHNSAEESFFDPVQVASSMARLYSFGIPAYTTRDPDVDLKALSAELSLRGLWLESIPGSRVVKLVGSE